MKQYDRIWVSDENGDHEVCDVEYITPERGRLSPEDNVIVITIEELREVWDECRDETWQDARPTTKYEKPNRLPGFEGYMQSKGIKID